MVQFLSGPALRRFSTLLAISILTLVAIAGTSGVLLAFYYRPEAGGPTMLFSKLLRRFPMAGWSRGYIILLATELLFWD